MTRLYALLLATSLALFAQNRPAAPLERIDGYLPLLWNAEQGKLLFEITRFDTDILYFTSVAKGAGSGSVGLEVAGGGEGGVIQFQRVGPKVLMVEKNLSYRAGAGNAELAAGIETSYPDSVIASLPIVESADGKVIADATAFVIRDAVGLSRRGGGRGGNNATAWQFDANRSAIYLPRTKGFPKNTEIEVTATYQAQSGGARTAPESGVLTGRLHYSFVEPPTGYTTRKADPRIGVISMGYADYSQPVSNATRVEVVRRHRLEKADPTKAVSDPIEPIVYYLDAAVPEPTRSAIKDGVRWWNKGFLAAGFTNALEIRDAPPEMDPMDVRYNHIYWVNRDERGYSTGGGISDPRTGEMISARVRLESDRVRTVSAYWQSYHPPVSDRGATSGNQEEEFFLQLPPYATPETEEQLVLLRQALLAAHEVGHSLGFEHNWAASINDRASVMDYPSPRLKLVGGRIDMTDAYQTSIGAYDELALRYAYTVFPAGREEAGLEAIIQEMRRRGILYTPSSDPRWNRYDDLADPADYLRSTMEQRKVLFANYGPNLLAPGEPYGNLRGMRLWMTYLHHRWAIDTSVRYIGGMYQNIVVKGESLPPTEIVPAAKQREILKLLLDSLEPDQLAIPEEVLASLTISDAPSANSDLENFDMATGSAFDQLSAARMVAGLVLRQLLEPEKSARLISFADRQANALTLPEVLTAATDAIWGRPLAGTTKSLRRQVQRIYLESLLALGAANASTPDVKALVMSSVIALHKRVAGMSDRDPLTEAHLRQAERDLARFIEDPTKVPPSSAPAPPVMAPI